MARIRSSRVNTEILAILYKCKRSFVRNMITKRLSGPTTANSLSVRTGALRRSLIVRVLKKGRKKKILAAGIGRGVPYARIHEFGGVLRPTGGRRFLAIPFKSALTTAGVQRVSPRDFPGELEFIVTKRGSRILAMIQDGMVIPMFTLVPSVTIPPRLGFVKTFNRSTGQCLRKIRSKVRTILVI